MSWHVSPWIYPVWDSLCFLDLIGYFPSHIREAFNYNLFKYFLSPFLFLFFFWDHCNSNVGAFNVVPEVSETASILFILFSLFCSVVVISAILYSRTVTSPFFCLSYSAIDSFYRIFNFIYCVVHQFVCSLVLLGPC